MRKPARGAAKFSKLSVIGTVGIRLKGQSTFIVARNAILRPLVPRPRERLRVKIAATKKEKDMEPNDARRLWEELKSRTEEFLREPRIREILARLGLDAPFSEGETLISPEEAPPEAKEEIEDISLAIKKSIERIIAQRASKLKKKYNIGIAGLSIILGLLLISSKDKVSKAYLKSDQIFGEEDKKFLRSIGINPDK